MYDNNDSIVIGGTPSRFLAFTEHFRAVKTYLSCCKRIFESIAKLTSSLHRVMAILDSPISLRTSSLIIRVPT